MSLRPTMLVAPIIRYLSRLRFPTLFILTAGLFVIDLIVPDLLPFADEILLGLGAAVLSQWRRRREIEPGEGSSESETPAIEGR